ncbi:MAG: NAD-dependent epimerase/dehydratase family protein [bacterium]|jgi:UDP-glucose 4-epimerase|nr:NAD-dependent epimerase/dehydratase family protein [bacterium]
MLARRVLVTGGAGFIGTRLAERLAGTREVVLFDNFRRDSLRYSRALRDEKGVEVRTGDVLDAKAVGTAVAGVDAVVHLAAIAGVSSYYGEPLRTLQVNVMGTVNVLEAVARQRVGRVVYLSTSEVFGTHALWVDEDSPHGIGPVTDRRWVYATSKLAGEHFVLRAGEQHGFAATVLRPFNVYGPRQTGEGAISNFCRAAVRGEPLRVYGDGSAIRAWCYVDDAVDAIEAALDASAAGGEVFNMGNPREVETTMGLARRVSDVAESCGLPRPEIAVCDVRQAEVRARVPNIDRAREKLRFDPRISLAEGLRRTLAWFRDEEAGPV